MSRWVECGRSVGYDAGNQGGLDRIRECRARRGKREWRGSYATACDPWMGNFFTCQITMERTYKEMTKRRSCFQDSYKNRRLGGYKSKGGVDSQVMLSPRWCLIETWLGGGVSREHAIRGYLWTYHIDKGNTELLSRPLEDKERNKQEIRLTVAIYNIQEMRSTSRAI